LLNVTGSSLQIVSSAIALGIAVAIGYGTEAQLLQSYRVLMGFLSACTVLVTVPFFLAQQHRPGQQLPAGVSMLQAGPQQVWSAMKSIRHLKQVFLYLVAYFMLQESECRHLSIISG
jgi:MFS-type transporter involved in bile tolerance (Atg22 family)